MFGNEVENDWNFVEYAPKTFGGYSTETKTTTIYQDNRKPETNEYILDFSKTEYDGSLYGYRIMTTKYPKFRANGVSPIALVDVVSYDYSSRQLRSRSSGFVNIIKSDSLLTGIVVLISQNLGFGPSNLNDPPNHWDLFKAWTKTTQRHSEVHPTNGWCDVLSNSRIRKSDYLVSVKEVRSPWKMVQNYSAEDAYLTTIQVAGRSGRTCTFRGTTCGSPKSRKKMVLSFIDSVLIALDLD